MKCAISRFRSFQALGNTSGGNDLRDIFLTCFKLQTEDLVPARNERHTFMHAKQCYKSLKSSATVYRYRLINKTVFGSNIETFDAQKSSLSIRLYSKVECKSQIDLFIGNELYTPKVCMCIILNLNLDIHSFTFIILSIDLIACFYEVTKYIKKI